MQNKQLSIFDICPELLNETNFDDIPESAENQNAINYLHEFGERRFDENSTEYRDALKDFSAAISEYERLSGADQILYDPSRWKM